MPAVVLPGPKLFQANRVDPSFMRPAVFHCFGRDKSGAKNTLRVMAAEGWETLIAVLLGVGHLRPLWQQTGWTPFGGMCWHGSAPAATLSVPLRQHLFEFWKPSGQQHQPQWLLPNQEPAVHLPPLQKRRLSTEGNTSGEPLGSSGDALMTKSESNASDPSGRPLGLSAASLAARSIPGTQSLRKQQKLKSLLSVIANLPLRGHWPPFTH